jgi:HK97 family phage major capsid protein
MMTKKQLLDRMSAIVEGAKREGRSLSAAEVSEFDSLEARFAMVGVPETRGGTSGGRTPDDLAFTHYLRTGDFSRLNEVRSDGTGWSTQPNDAGVSAGSTTSGAGGYLVPQGFWQNIQVALKAFSGIANDFRRVETPTGNPMPWPTVDPTSVVGTVLGASNELNQASIVNSYAFGQGMLNAWTVTNGGPLLVSMQLAEDNAFDIDSFVAERHGESIGRKLAALAVTGSGSGQHLGITTALAAKGAASGASGGCVQLGTATAVKTFGGSTTELSGNVLSPETLAQLIQAVDPAYYHTTYGDAKFYMNSTQAWNLRTVVDANNRPLLNLLNGLTADDMASGNYSQNSPVGQLFGFDLIIDNSIGNLTASTTTGPIFGNLAHAMVNRVVSPGVRILRLTERCADYLALGYYGYHRSDFRSKTFGLPRR